MISEKYEALAREEAELILGLMALCHCNHKYPEGRPQTWAWDESLPWSALRARIRDLKKLREGAR